MDKGEIKCPECGKLFPGAYMLAWHIRSAHTSHHDIEIDESTFVGIEIERLYEYGREVEDPAVLRIYEGDSSSGEEAVESSSILTKLGTRLFSFSGGDGFEIQIGNVNIRVLRANRSEKVYYLEVFFEDERFLIVTDLEALNRLGNLLEEYGKVNYRFLRWSPGLDGNYLIPWKHEQKDEQPIAATHWESEGGQSKDLSRPSFILSLVAAIVAGLVLMILVYNCTGTLDESMIP